MALVVVNESTTALDGQLQQALSAVVVEALAPALTLTTWKSD